MDVCDGGSAVIGEGGVCVGGRIVGHVLTNSCKILYIVKKDFFQLNFHHSDQ